jgi:hypothetical protein
MSGFIISLLIAGGASAWIYTKFQRSSGSNTKQSTIASGFIGIFIFIVVLVITGMF